MANPVRATKFVTPTIAVEWGSTLEGALARGRARALQRSLRYSGRLVGGRAPARRDRVCVTDDRERFARPARVILDLELSPSDAPPGARRSWSLLLEADEAPPPWSQFYAVDTSCVSLGFHLGL